MSYQRPHEPEFISTYNEESITMSTTIASDQIDDALIGTLQRIRQAPIRSEPSWSSDGLERARVLALKRLKVKQRRPWEIINMLSRRAQFAFKGSPIPNFSDRIHMLSDQSNSELIRWYQKNIQATPALLVITGDLTEIELNRALMTFSSLKATEDTLQATPWETIARRKSQLNGCRTIHQTSDLRYSWQSHRYLTDPLQPNGRAALALIEGALTGPSLGVPKALRALGDVKVVVDENAAGQRAYFSIGIRAPLDLSAKASKLILKTLQSLVQTPMDLNTLQSVKRFTKAQQTHKLDQTIHRAQWLGRLWTLGWREIGHLGTAGWHQKIDALTADEVQSVAASIFKSERHIESLLASPQAKRASPCKRVIP